MINNSISSQTKALGKNKLILFEVSENPKEASTKNSPKNAVFLRSELLSP